MHSFHKHSEGARKEKKKLGKHLLTLNFYERQLNIEGDYKELFTAECRLANFPAGCEGIKEKSL